MKKQFYLQSLLWLCVLSAIAVVICKPERFNKSENELSVTNWNVQTFFDANTDGNEYSDFKKSKEIWNENYYKDRLKRLCQIIEELDSDVFVMEELENEKVLYDISNFLSHNSWYSDRHYNYAAFGKEPENSIGCGVISKIPIEDLKLHSLDIRTEDGKVPQMRAIMELSLLKNGQKISMFVNHWKSKSGGEQQSEKWRRWQENVLARECSSVTDVPVFACGDFNKDIGDFVRDEECNLEFNYIGKDSIHNIRMFSPWDENESADYGSYYFSGKWEKIDHFFCPENGVLKQFDVFSGSGTVKNDGTPNRYELFNHNGYSDHLPITCRIQLKGCQKNS